MLYVGSVDVSLSEAVLSSVGRSGRQEREGAL
jgi:hypothetical protein